MLKQRAPPAEDAINVPDPRAEGIDWSRACKRCQRECDWCRGWRGLYEQEGGAPVSPAGK